MSAIKPRRSKAMIGLIAVVGVLAFVVPLAYNAGAQPTTAPQVSLNVEMSDDGSQAVVTVELDPGTEIVAALDGVVSYNPDYATPTNCNDVNSLGACNPEGAGLIRFASASTDSWSSPSALLEISFDVTEPSDVAISIGAMYTPVNAEITNATVAGPVSLGTVVATGDGAVTGTILAGEGALFGTQVCAESDEVGASVCVDADSRGSYRIDGLASGDYVVTARHASGDYAVLQIPNVAVVSPELTQGVDGVLGAAIDEIDETNDVPASETSEPATAASTGLATSTVSGSVTTTAGVAIPAALVCVEDVAIGQPSCGGSGFDGTYEINNLEPGNYVVTITDPGGRYADQTGPTFGLGAGDQRTDVDFTLTAG